MTKEESKALYEGKYFYEVDKYDERIELYGPLDNIYYIETDPMQNPEIKVTPRYTFCQVIDGQVTKAYLANEILVLNYKL
jgi:hypothetical protein